MFGKERRAEPVSGHYVSKKWARSVVKSIDQSKLEAPLGYIEGFVAGLAFCASKPKDDMYGASATEFINNAFIAAENHHMPEDVMTAVEDMISDLNSKGVKFGGAKIIDAKTGKVYTLDLEKLLGEDK